MEEEATPQDKKVSLRLPVTRCGAWPAMAMAATVVD